MLVTKRDGLVYAKFDYDKRENFKKHVRGASWDPGTRSWVAPATISTFKNLKSFDPVSMDPDRLSPEIRTWYNSLLTTAKRLDELQKGTGDAPKFKEDFTFTFPPYKHQKEAMAFAINLPKCALWLDLGLGKTYTSINVARYRNKYQDVTKVLVVCPLAIMHQWKDEVAKYAPEADAVVLDGTPKRKDRLLDEVMASDKFTFVIVTYESVYTLADSLDAAQFDMFILDESTKIKNPRARRTKSVVSLCQTIQYGIELTGLAYLNNPVDLFSQFLALDTTVYGENEWVFKDRYIEWTKVPFGPGKVARGLKNLDELKRRAYFIAFSRNKKQCLDLPDKIYSVRKLPMYDEQAQAYKEILAETVDLAKEIVPGVALSDLSITNILTKIEKLQQVTSGFILLPNGKPHFFDSPKYSEICDIVQDSGENFIIWARHHEAMDRMLAALRSRNINAEKISAEVKGEKRKNIIKAFKEGHLKAVVCQLQSECRGLDLTSVKAVNSVYLENTYSIDERWQSESRQHRIGMKGSAAYIDVVLEDTIDEQILGILKNKLTVSEYISQYGLEILLGKGGTMTLKKTRPTKKKSDEEDLDLAGLGALGDIGSVVGLEF